MSFVLEFEKQVREIEKKVEELREASKIGDINVASEITRMQNKIDKLLSQIYKNLTPWQKVQVARHPDRPKFLDYLNGIFTDFIELHGDRLFADDRAIIGGFAKISGIKCIVIGQEKGSDTESRLEHNFGAAKPEGYRKVLRLLDLAQRFSLPILSFIDTSGAYPGVESEERGVAEAIARCMEKSLQIDVPFVSTVIGEGGSGGAIAIASSDYVLMFEYSIYSVISPEGCASILWKDGTKANLAAETQKLTAEDLYSLGIVDSIVKEPIGGAHRNKQGAIENLKKELLVYLKKSESLPQKSRKLLRRKRFMSIGDQFVVKS
ncbi:MAG: acetyl-CoA carboxylase carboxyltransferase subunit alpha [Holosporales bacterium]|jgi:acetyl-CoA carboxylase carboxyl transferase subunit alpha|nr:acetyl-CoA carboxylase carboxyltransferase subunit alpha [Holosporales bacterium]